MELSLERIASVMFGWLCSAGTLRPLYYTSLMYSWNFGHHFGTETQIYIPRDYSSLCMLSNPQIQILIRRYILTPLHIFSVSNWPLILSQNSPLSLLPQTTLSKPATSFSRANELWMRPLALIECWLKNLRLIVIDWKGYLLLFRNFLKENTCRV